MNTFSKSDKHHLPALTTLPSACQLQIMHMQTTLAQRAVYDMKILVGGDPAEVGQCSAFAFGDISTVCGACCRAFC